MRNPANRLDEVLGSVLLSDTVETLLTSPTVNLHEFGRYLTESYAVEINDDLQSTRLLQAVPPRRIRGIRQSVVRLVV